MGFFKNIGKAIKNVGRGISLNNIVKVATGSAGQVLGDLKTRAVEGLTNTENTNPVVDQQIIDYGNAVGDMYIKPLVDKAKQTVAYSQVGQELATFGTKLYFQTMWTKYKNYILAGLVVIALVVIWKKFGNRTRSRVRR